MNSTTESLSLRYPTAPLGIASIQSSTQLAVAPMEGSTQEPCNRTFDFQITQWEHRDALCRLTKLVDEMPILDRRILESQRLLDRAASIMREVVPELREMCIMREKLENDYFEKMKVKKELYDGTARLEREPRRSRIKWLKAERKKTRVAKWEKQNLFNKENDLPESDYENYSTKSDSEGTLWSSDES